MNNPIDLATPLVRQFFQGNSADNPQPVSLINLVHSSQCKVPGRVGDDLFNTLLAREKSGLLIREFLQEHPQGKLDLLY